MPQNSTVPKILIVGGGYAGFYTAWKLEKHLRKGEAASMPIQIRSRRGVDEKLAAQVLPEARSLATRYPDDAAVLSVLAEAEHEADRQAEHDGQREDRHDRWSGTGRRSAPGRRRRRGADHPAGCAGQ